MSDMRTALISALQKVAEGGDITHAGLIEIAHPAKARVALTGMESQAYWSLWRWADDTDIRIKEPRGSYEERERESVAKLRDALAGTE